MAINYLKILPLVLVYHSAWAIDADLRVNTSAEHLRSMTYTLGKQAKASSYYYNNDLNKIKALYGNWQLIAQTAQPRRDILAVDSNFVDKNFGTYGWDTRQRISCFYEPQMLGSNYDYLCLQLTDSVAGTAKRYLFNLSKQTLSGKYHFGTAADFIKQLNSNKLYDLIGYQNGTEPYYQESSSQLVLPSVAAFNKRYSVILQRQNDGKFNVQFSLPHQ